MTDEEVMVGRPLFEKMLGDLVALVARSSHLPLTADRKAAIRVATDGILAAYDYLERRARAGSPERPEVQVVQGGPDPADPERGPDLPRLRRLAAEAGATFAINTDPLLGGRDPVAASLNHKIEILRQQYVATNDRYPEPHGYYVAEMDGFVCGPCRTWEMHRSIPERNAAIARHTGRPYFS